MAAYTDPPLISLRVTHPWGGEGLRPVRLHARVIRPDGTQGARISYPEIVGGEPVDVQWTVDADELVELPGVDYGDVPVERLVREGRTGTVASGHEWRRTG